MDDIKKSTQSLAAFADDREIVRLIAGERVKYVRKRDAYFEGMCTKEPVINPELDALTPPYKSWRKYGNTGRSGGNAKYKALRNGLTRMMLRDLEKNELPTYAYRLREFIDDIRAIAKSGEFSFGKPTVLAQFKEQEGSVSIYRPVSTYRNLRVKTVIALLSDYLSTLFDPYFHEEMLAFRKPRDYHSHKRAVTTNHDALERILEYRTKHDSEDIWVCECDIQKFFDSIDHEVVMKAFDRLAAIVAKEHPGMDLIPARCLLTAFCSSFNFFEDVYSCNDNQEYWKRTLGAGWREGMICRFAWLKIIPDNPKSLGIPQGAALSAIITNMVLSSVDESIVRMPDTERLFIRYCDDIVLMHTSRETISSLSLEYRRSLEEHILPYHSFKDVDNTEMKQSFWSHCKSKSPYLWGRGGRNSSEWVGFLGFEVHRNGNVRMRKSSLQKKQDKIYRDYKQIVSDADAWRRERHMKAFSSMSIAIPASEQNGKNLVQSHSGITANPYTNRQLKSLRRSRQYNLEKLLKGMD